MLVTLVTQHAMDRSGYDDSASQWASQPQTEDRWQALKQHMIEDEDTRDTEPRASSRSPGSPEAQEGQGYACSSSPFPPSPSQSPRPARLRYAPKTPDPQDAETQTEEMPVIQPQPSTSALLKRVEELESQLEASQQELAAAKFNYELRLRHKHNISKQDNLNLRRWKNWQKFPELHDEVQRRTLVEQADLKAFLEKNVGRKTPRIVQLMTTLSAMKILNIEDAKKMTASDAKGIMWNMITREAWNIQSKPSPPISPDIGEHVRIHKVNVHDRPDLFESIGVIDNVVFHPIVGRAYKILLSDLNIKAWVPGDEFTVVDPPEVEAGAKAGGTPSKRLKTKK
jgi:hypothetical protein